MVLSTPVLRPKSRLSFNTTVRQGTNLGDYLHHVNELLVQQNFNLANDYSTAISQLKHTLIRLEVAQIKRTAIVLLVRVSGIFIPLLGLSLIKCLLWQNLNPTIMSLSLQGFDDFLNDVDSELMLLIGKTSFDFPHYEFESDFDSQFPVSLSAQEAIIQHRLIH